MNQNTDEVRYNTPVMYAVIKSLPYIKYVGLGTMILLVDNSFMMSESWTYI